MKISIGQIDHSLESLGGYFFGEGITCTSVYVPGDGDFATDHHSFSFMT
jgi:hypothetical protein